MPAGGLLSVNSSLLEIRFPTVAGLSSYQKNSAPAILLEPISTTLPSPSQIAPLLLATASGIGLISTMIGLEVATHPLASVTRTDHSPDKYAGCDGSIVVEPEVVVKPGIANVPVLSPSGPIHSNCVPLVLVVNITSLPSQFGSLTAIVGVSGGGKIFATETLAVILHPFELLTTKT